VDVINKHNFTDSPMFMYLSFQAVHDPWTDMDGKGTPGVKFADGIPESYFEANSSVYSYVQSMYPGGNVRQYYMALGLMDSAVESIYAAVDARDVIDNTYFIFASDNGGCPTSGGRNAPLRGGKSTLFEGGTRVEAFFYSKKLDDSRKGAEVNGLFHVTDWFPTILDLAGVSTYSPTYALDGFSQYSSLLSGTDSPREFVL
jgi:arylsulfatase A-like enzyme